MQDLRFITSVLKTKKAKWILGIGVLLESLFCGSDVVYTQKFTCWRLARQRAGAQVAETFNRWGLLGVSK